MVFKVAQSLLLLLLLTGAVMAQIRSRRQTVEARARQFEPYILASAKRYGVDAHVLRVICFMESRFRVNALSPKGARGPMQFMPETAQRYGLTNPEDPQASIDAAARYLRDLLAKFGGRIDLALAAYNAGEGTVDSFRSGRPLLLTNGKVINPRRLITGGVPPYRETRQYVAYGLSHLRTGDGEITSFQFLTPLNNKPMSFDIRDFTIDVLTSRPGASVSKSERARSLFIEVP
jgi:soluble lytic murein transglycosylase-like protein